MRTAFTPTRKPYRFCPGVYNVKRGGFVYSNDRLTGIELHRDKAPEKLILSKKKPEFTKTIEGDYEKTMRSMGDRATGLEPDICLEFFRESNGTFTLSGTHLADAKNNQAHDGRAYRAGSVKTAFHYLQSYQQSPLDLTKPKFTLFFHQGGNKVVGKKRDGDKITPQCFKDFDVVGLGYAQGDFEGDLIREWFSAILPSP
ncbi:MAG: hypothetical protein ABF384_15010 [Verrucomicrobiales bacterium]